MHRRLRICAAALLCLVAACGGGESGQAEAPVAIPAGLERLPDGDAFALKVFPDASVSSRWCVFRGWPDERLYVYSDCNSGSPRRVPFSRGTEGELLLLAATADDEQLWLLAYDARLNVPAGRLASVLSDGVDVFLFGAAGGEPVRMAEPLPLAGLDYLLYAGMQGRDLLACAINRCFSVREGAPTLEWNTDALGGYVFVEAVFDAGAAAAIVRTQDDPVTGSAELAGFHYALARLSQGAAQVEPLPADCLPYALASGSAGISWKCAATRADLADLLKREIARMPHHGMMEFGSSNLEGRLVWSQVYYLNGLMHLGGPHLPILSQSADWNSLRGRLQAEIALLAQRARSGVSGYAARRYSLRRTEVVSALHLGRIARTLRTAIDLGYGSAEVQEALALLERELRSLEVTLEELTTDSQPGASYVTLGFRRNADFWADGVNVPFNVISGYVEGLLASGEDEAAISRAIELMRPLLTLESIETASSWQYWWGTGRQGWSAASNVSTNTPSYPGFTGVAHISYRSMDAATLARLYALRNAAVPAPVLANIRHRTATGALWPWMNETLIQAGGPVQLEPRVAYRFARSSYPGELQAQVWALEQFAAGR